MRMSATLMLLFPWLEGTPATKQLPNQNFHDKNALEINELNADFAASVYTAVYERALAVKRSVYTSWPRAGTKRLLHQKKCSTNPAKSR